MGSTLGKQAALRNHLFYQMNGTVWLSEGALGDLGGGKFTAMRGRSHETGPEGHGEEGLDDQSGPKGRPKGAQEQSPGHC